MAHHEPLKALGPVDWSDVAHDDLKHFLTSTFSRAQTVIDSIPTPPPSSQPVKPARPPQQTGRTRSHTDGSVAAAAAAAAPPTTAPAPTTPEAVAKLHKEWKEVRVPPRENPLGISVYKLAGRDGRGAWFARRSVHLGGFDKFRLGLEREFGETLRNSRRGSGPGTGNVRGIGAERRAELRECEGVGAAAVWLLSAQFPGPTTPRDFVTLLLTGEGGGGGGTGGGRQFMVVSRPCSHPECAPRSGYIRGCYESVEIIREVPVETPVRRVRSSDGLRGEDDAVQARARARLSGDGSSLSKDAVLRSAAQKAGRKSDEAGAGERGLARTTTDLLPTQDSPTAAAESETEMAVEWIMVTRSDPGGSVPRFMVEKGTPGGIVNDAGRFIKWLDGKSMADLERPDDAAAKEEPMKSEGTLPPAAAAAAAAAPTDNNNRSAVNAHSGALPPHEDQYPPSGLYSMIAGALGAASSVVASRLPNLSYNTSTDHDTTEEDESESDTESDASFASAQEPDEPTPLAETTATTTGGGGGGDMRSLHSGKSDESSANKASTQHERQLRKLQERYRKLEEKRARQLERTDNDDALARLREKHDRELARQEDNYRKEVRKLEERRLKEERKAEQRRRKEADKEARGNLALELERTRVERDMALKQIDILKEQVGSLQAQNTQLVVKLGKLGRADGLGGSGKGDDEKMSQKSSQSK